MANLGLTAYSCSKTQSCAVFFAFPKDSGLSWSAHRLA